MKLKDLVKKLGHRPEVFWEHLEWFGGCGEVLEDFVDGPTPICPVCSDNGIVSYMWKVTTYNAKDIKLNKLQVKDDTKIS